MLAHPMLCPLPFLSLFLIFSRLQAHLKQLEELQLQRQMLLQAEARLKMTLGGVGPPPAGMELPSYDQAMPTGPPPPFPTMMVNSRSHPYS